MKQRRLTTISLLCGAFMLAAAEPSGPAIGSRFPGDLHALLGTKGAAIFFSRSTEECQICKSLVSEIEQHKEAFEKLGFKATALSDERIRSSPGWFVLDSKGAIVAKYFGEQPGDSYTSAALLVHRFGWMPQEPGTEVEGKQLTATAGASNSKLANGERVALTLDLDLPPSMHVYAPGVENYIPIDWKMDDSGPAEVHAPVFPRAEKLYLKAIGETVPAYRNHFRLIRDITLRPVASRISGLDADGWLTVTGSLRYQACDDRVCYIPQTLHLEWKFAYQPPDR